MTDSNRRITPDTRPLFFLKYVWDVPPETLRLAYHLCWVGV